MIRRPFLILMCCLLASLGSVTAQAQEGIGLQTYITSVGEFNTITVAGLGVGLGAKIAPRIVLSFAYNVSRPPVLGALPNTQVEPPLEFACAAAYVFNDSNPSPYVFFGYSHFPKGGLSAAVEFVHIGLGFAPRDIGFDVYPELSIVVPLHSHLTWQEKGLPFTYSGRVPVYLRATVKVYFVPSIPPFWKNSDKK